MLGHDWASPERDASQLPAVRREVIPHFQGQLDAPRASHDWATDKRGELFGRAGAGDGATPSPAHVEEKAKDAPRRGDRRPRRWRPDARRLAQGGTIYVRDDVPEPVPGFGQVLVQVKACGICGSDLHFAKHGADMLDARRRR